MTISFQCVCGRALRAPEELAGRTTKCPACSQPVAIPRPDGAKAEPMVLSCACGKKIAAQPHWAGKMVRCPGCQNTIKVPEAILAPIAPPTPPAKAMVAAVVGAAKPALQAMPVAHVVRPQRPEPEEEFPTAPRYRPEPAKRKSGGGSLLKWLAALLVFGGAGLAAGVFLGDPIRAMVSGTTPAKKGDDPKKTRQSDDEKKDDDGKPMVAEEPDVRHSIVDNAGGFVVLRYADFLKSKAGRRTAELVRQAYVDNVHRSPLHLFLEMYEARDVAIVWPDPLKPAGRYSVVTLGKEVDEFKLTASNPKFEKVDLAGKTLWLVPGPDGYAVTLAGPNVVVVGAEAAIVNLLTKGTAQAGPLSPAINEAGPGRPRVFAAFQVTPEWAKSFGIAGIEALFTDAKEITLLAEGEALKFEVAIRFADNAAAKEAKDRVAAAVFLFNEWKKQLPIDWAGLGAIIDAASVTDPELSGDAIKFKVKNEKTFADLAEAILPPPRKKANASEDLNDLKRLAAAMHKFHATAETFPVHNKDKLSWRVDLLDHLGEGDRAKKFKREEPWDSDHNRALLVDMPEVFRHPKRSAPPGYTFYRVFAGPRTIFPEGGGVSMAKITDGTANTFLIVEASEAVPWTKCDELVIDADPQSKLPDLGDPANGGTFMTAMADGTALWLNSAPPETLRALITIDGGEVVDLKKLRK